MDSLYKVRNVCCKVYFCVVFFITLLLFYLPVRLLTLRLSTQRAAFKVQVMWSFVYRVLSFHHIRYMAKAVLPEGPAIIIANHTSFLDIFLMYSLFPSRPFLFMGKAEILSYPFLKGLFKGYNIPVFRNNKVKAAKSFIQARQRIEQGWSVVIFPEGGIPDSGWPEMIPFKEGAFVLAQRTGVPIIPVSFTNNYKLFSEPESPFASAYPGFSTVYIHPFISSEQVKGMNISELSAHAFSVIQQPIIGYKS